MKLSRIVTLHNQWHYLDWLADDTLFADGNEFIFVDDCSTEPMPADLPARLAARCAILHRLPRNRGRSVARNTGTGLAHGDWVEFVDGDDRPLPLRWNEAWAGSDLVLFPATGHGPEKPEAHQIDANHFLLRDPKSPTGHRDPRPANTLWRKVALDDLGGFDPRMEPVEDLDLAWRALSRPAAYATAPKQSYNHHGASLLKGIESTAAFLKFYKKVAGERTDCGWLIEWEVRNLWHHATWHLLQRRHYGELFRKGCVLVFNVTKAKLRDLFSRRS
ncbi:MAG: glycosyltransferase [Verrucomicrobia bacterium]|nr:glycosyltransferase [Verrucomicrobiota bacterium]